MPCFRGQSTAALYREDLNAAKACHPTAWEMYSVFPNRLAQMDLQRRGDFSHASSEMLLGGAYPIAGCHAFAANQRTWRASKLWKAAKACHPELPLEQTRSDFPSEVAPVPGEPSFWVLQKQV